MTFEEVLDQAIDMVRRRGRVTYHTLQRQFSLDDAALEDLKDELLFASPHIADEAGRGLVWMGEDATPATPTHSSTHPAQPAVTPASEPTPTASPPAAYHAPDAERRQLTVMFCDLVDSTALASRLDPEDLREVIRAYQGTCAEVIQRFDGHIAQYLGDGLLVYFGYPQAHEDDAQRAVHAGLGLVEALDTLNRRRAPGQAVPLALRVGIHTGVAVVGEIGGGGRQEQLALGETPNVAARLQGLAAPNTVVISAATQRLIQGYFTCHDLGLQSLKGIATPLYVAQVVSATEVQQRFDVAAARGLTPLVGREHEVGLLWERLGQVQAGNGQIVVLSGEAGIGKSRLVQVLKDEMSSATALRIEYRCSPYHQHSAFYPVITHLERVLAWRQDDPPPERLRKLSSSRWG
jgi:class 3 adenylate cyclase